MKTSEFNIDFPKEFQRMQLDFAFTKMVNGANSEKLDYVFELEKKVNETLKIADYSDKIQGLIFVFILHNNNSLPNNDYISLIRKRSKLEIGLSLDYNNFIKTDKENWPEIMIIKYLNTIVSLLPKRKDFNSKKFFQDNVKLFESYLQPIKQ